MARRDRLERGQQQAFDLEALPPQPTRQLARKLSPPKPPSPPRSPSGARLATKIPAPGTQEPSFDPDDTRAILARQRTGVARRTIASDIEVQFDMFPVASSRVAMMGYNENVRVVRVRFADGTPWEYHDVDPETWNQFRISDSPGRFIHDVLDRFPYGRGAF